MRLELETRLAWRNVWRNRRRSALTVAATVFAVFLTVFFVAMTDGVHGKLIEDSVRIYSGHVTLASPGYREERTLEHFVSLDGELAAALDATPGVVGWTPRIVSFALVSKDEASHGVVVMGVDPETEGQVSTLPGRVVDGHFLSMDGRPGGAGEDGGGERRPILLGRRLAEALGAGIGDRILVYGIAYSLENAYDLFEVEGVIALPDPALERRLALIRLDDARDFYVYGDRVSEIAVLAAGADDSEEVQGALASALSSGNGGNGSEGGQGRSAPIAVHTWREMMPDLDQYIFLDRAGMLIMLVILIVVVGFGILNTVLMAVLERTRELGVMLALGLRPAAVFRIVTMESLSLASVGLIIGLALAIPVVLWLVAHPIPLSGNWGEMTELIGAEPVIVFELEPDNPVRSSLTILGVALVASLYPAWKASRGRPVDALRSV